MKRFFPLLALICLFGACVSQEKETAPGVDPETARDTALISSPEKGNALERFPSGDGLDAPRFRNIPQEAKNYLRTLGQAFRAKDRKFLLSQGETQYEKELRYEYDEETYLALLYRIGPYSAETPLTPLDLPRLKYTQIRAIEYQHWEEKGPILEITGRLYLQNGSALPCGITLVWRLVEPKILGARP